MVKTIDTPQGRFQFRQEDGSLLTALERQGLALEYQCRQGYCGACRTPLLGGEVSYLTAPLAFVARGEILPCCCRPKGDVALAIAER